MADATVDRARRRLGTAHRGFGCIDRQRGRAEQVAPRSSPGLLDGGTDQVREAAGQATHEPEFAPRCARPCLQAREAFTASTDFGSVDDWEAVAERGRNDLQGDRPRSVLDERWELDLL